MKYLVMECRRAYAVVLGDDGTFLKVANMRYEVGQTVTDVILLNLPEVTEQPKTNHKRWISSFAAMAACLALVITSIFFTGQMPYASVYMTINPEVRIDVSRSDVVVGVEGMNTDGTELLEGYDHKKKDLDTVMDELVDRAIDMGYLHEGGKITLSLDGDEEWIVSHETHLNQHLNDHLTDKITVTIDIEQKQPEQPTPTAPTGTIVIPVGPDNYDDSDYDDGESDYDPTDAVDSDYGETDYVPEETEGESDYGETDYIPEETEGESDYGETDYIPEETEGESDYDDWSEDDVESEYGEQSDYGDTEDQGQSDYGDGEYDAASDYDEPNNGGQTNYDDANDDFSNYEEANSEYGDSDYDEE